MTFSYHKINIYLQFYFLLRNISFVPHSVRQLNRAAILFSYLYSRLMADSLVVEEPIRANDCSYSVDVDTIILYITE